MWSFPLFGPFERRLRNGVGPQRTRPTGQQETFSFYGPLPPQILHGQKCPRGLCWGGQQWGHCQGAGGDSRRTRAWRVIFLREFYI